MPQYRQEMPLLIMFIGFPGSEKTYFARKLAERIHAVTFNSDAMRISMFKSLNRIEQLRKEDNTRLYQDVFGAMDYAAAQVLRAGYHVVFDAQMAKRRDRQHLETLAKQCGAKTILVWIKTDPDVAMKRGQVRVCSDDSHPYHATKMKMLINRFPTTTELPDKSEKHVIIDGELEFEEQYSTFLKVATISQ